jgi:hypothetical protein
VEAPADWGLVGTSSSFISISSLQSNLSYCVLRPGGCAEAEGLEGGGAAAGVVPKVEGVRLPTELDAVEDDSVRLEETLDGGRAPRKR